MSPVHGEGRICHWDGGSIWIGRAIAANDFHAHHAVQVALALEGHFRFRSPADDAWLDCRGAVIASNHPHAFDGRQAPLLAHLFIEPESPTGRALLRNFSGPHGICRLDGPLLDTAIGALADRYRAWSEPADLILAARGVLRGLTAGVDQPEPVDPRILRALAYIREHLDRTITLPRTAASVHLSPDRFRHLFVKELGLAFRHYVLWLRLGRALEAFAEGASLTTAAYRAGFADSAHLSRTFRRMYGMAPATLSLE